MTDQNEPVDESPPEDQISVKERQAVREYLRENGSDAVQAALAVEDSRLAYLTTAAKRSERRERWRNIMIALILAFGIWASTTSVDLSNQVRTSQEETAARGRLNRKLLLNIQSLVAFTDRFDSPATKAANDLKTKQLLTEFAGQLNCQTRQALQDAIDKVYGESVGSILCPPAPPVSGTTTTTPGG